MGLRQHRVRGLKSDKQSGLSQSNWGFGFSNPFSSTSTLVKVTACFYTCRSCPVVGWPHMLLAPQCFASWLFFLLPTDVSH